MEVPEEELAEPRCELLLFDVSGLVLIKYREEPLPNDDGEFAVLHEGESVHLAELGGLGVPDSLEQVSVDVPEVGLDALLEQRGVVLRTEIVDQDETRFLEQPTLDLVLGHRRQRQRETLQFPVRDRLLEEE